MSELSDREIILVLAGWAVVMVTAGFLISMVIWPAHPSPVAADVFPNECPSIGHVICVEQAGG